MTAAPEIRRATETDAAAIARCYRRAYATAAGLGYRTRLTGIDAETVASWLTDDGVTLVADADGDLVGTVRLCDAGPVATLERIAVVPDRQREGIGTRLFDRIETLARERGDDRLRLTTFRDHPFLLEWYRSRGYHSIGLPDQPGWAGEFVSMEKSFADAPDPGESTADGRAAHSDRGDDSASTST